MEPKSNWKNRDTDLDLAKLIQGELRTDLGVKKAVVNHFELNLNWADFCGSVKTEFFYIIILKLLIWQFFRVKS